MGRLILGDGRGVSVGFVVRVQWGWWAGLVFWCNFLDIGGTRGIICKCKTFVNHVRIFFDDVIISFGVFRRKCIDLPGHGLFSVKFKDSMEVHVFQVYLNLKRMALWGSNSADRIQCTTTYRRHILSSNVFLSLLRSSARFSLSPIQIPFPFLINYTNSLVETNK